MNMPNTLLTWYDEHKRNLPWRADKHPYHIWVSEIMAQQTQIATLLPYYIKFIEKFPDVYALADAPMDDVLHAVAGIGYYTRFHNMKKAAQMIVRDFNGNIPNTAKQLRTLPGIGDYAAGAIASIAFDEKIPAIDGNVLRVMARFERNKHDITKTSTKQTLTKHLTAMMPERAGDFNQALMELGALVCKPQNPLCDACPLVTMCKGIDICNDLPYKPAKKPVKEMDKTVIVLCTQDAVFMRQRTEKLLHGMWEFYHVDKKITADAVMKKLNHMDIQCRRIENLGDATHRFTHLKWNMTGYKVITDNIPELQDYVLIPLHQLSGIVMPIALKHYYQQLMP